MSGDDKKSVPLSAPSNSGAVAGEPKFSSFDLTTVAWPAATVARVFRFLSSHSFYSTVADQFDVDEDDVDGMLVGIQLCQEFLLQQDAARRASGDFVMRDTIFVRVQSQVPAGQTSLAATPSSANSPAAMTASIAPPSGGVQLQLESTLTELRSGVRQQLNNVDDDNGDEARNQLAEAAAAEAADGALKANAEEFLRRAAAQTPGMPDALYAEVRRRLEEVEVLDFGGAPARLSQEAELCQTAVKRFKVPASTGAMPAAVQKQEAALYSEAVSYLELLALIVTADAVDERQLFGEDSPRMALAYLHSLSEILVHKIRSVNFARSQLMLTGTARDIYTASATAAVDDSRRHMFNSPAFAAITAAQQQAKLWAPAAAAQRPSSSSTSASTSAAASSAVASPKKKNNNRKRNNKKPMASNSDTSKTASPAAKSPAKDKQ